MLANGAIVAGYRIEGVLGEGRTAVVYRATELSLNRVVALKVVSEELRADPSFPARWQREGQLQGALEHPNIVTVFEAGESDSGPFMAMRLISGPTLKELILARALEPARAMHLLTQIAQALDALHAASLIHRDVKPQNILVDEHDQAFLADFGFTKALDDATGLTATGQFLGTIDYVAPEQIAERPTAASDCYALAAVLYECLTGRVPFPEASEAAVLYAQLMKSPPRVSEARPELPAALDGVIARGMAKDPAQRPPSATALMAEAREGLDS